MGQAFGSFLVFSNKRYTKSLRHCPTQVCRCKTLKTPMMRAAGRITKARYRWSSAPVAECIAIGLSDVLSTCCYLLIAYSELAEIRNPARAAAQRQAGGFLIKPGTGNWAGWTSGQRRLPRRPPRRGWPRKQRRLRRRRRRLRNAPNIVPGW